MLLDDGKTKLGTELFFFLYKHSFNVIIRNIVLFIMKKKKRFIKKICYIFCELWDHVYLSHTGYNEGRWQTHSSEYDWAVSRSDSVSFHWFPLESEAGNGYSEARRDVFGYRYLNTFFIVENRCWFQQR